MMKEKDNVIFKSAQEDFLDARYQQVENKIGYLLSEYPDEPDLKLLAINNWFELGQFIEVIKIIDDSKQDLPLDSVTLTKVIKSLLAQKQFQKSHVLLRQYHNLDLLPLVVNEEAQANNNPSPSLLKLKREFQYLGAFDYDRQLLISNDTKYLPLADYINGSIKVISDENVLPELRARHLNNLVILDEVDQLVEYRFIDDQLYNLNLKKLQAMPDYPTINLVNQKITAFLVDELKNPTLAEMVSQQLEIQQLLLYPFYDHIITDIDYWVKAVVAIVMGEQITPKNDQQEQIINWINLIYGF